MNKLGRSVLVGSLLVLSAVLGYTVYVELSATSTVPEQRPAFALPDLQGKVHDAAEWDGKVVLLNFWASWCGPCREEIPLLVEMQKTHGPHGLQIIGIALDEPEKAQQFAQEYGVNYPVLIALEGGIELSTAYGNASGSIPYSVLYNRQGHIKKAVSGRVTQENLGPAIIDALQGG